MTISVVICTYNPSEPVFSKVIEALPKLINSNGKLIEIILVDNNSKNPVSEIDYVRNFIRDSIVPVKIVNESKPGLTYARIKGTEQSSGEIILFVDDDNILHADYISNLSSLFLNYPGVCCWGPGIVDVEFSGYVEPWVSGYKSAFQQKSKPMLEYGCAMGWHSFSPAGTGLAVHKSVMSFYIELVNAKKLKAEDRTGKSLSSGGDSQIIHCCTIMGKASGQSPELKLVHLIAAEKANLNYIKQLLFMVNQSIYVHYEVFPELKVRLLHIPTKLALLQFCFSNLKKARFNIKSHKFVIPVAEELGLIYGSFRILGLPAPRLCRWLAKIIRVNI